MNTSPSYLRPSASICGFLFFALAVSAADSKVSFNRDIRPIMADTCFRCHGPDKSSRMAGMRLDIRAEALKPTATGVVPIVPGQPEKSAIIERIFSTNPVKLMPPKFAHKEITPAQKETIRRWVSEGAEYEGHWSYLPVKRPTPPDTALNPIDAFIRAQLTKEGLAPSPEADRRTLLRRVSLDLTGLPPTPQEIDAFVKDASPDAYNKLVDRLLASPRYAEKQALHWLDAVRYADTAGFHGDNPVPTWPYRDYVLQAFRDNKPFDQFTREQLAGDLIPNATREQRVASAYNRLNRTSAEGGLQPIEYLAKYAADRVRTTSMVWLGSTMGCAECHDHKFDPFLSKDFYAMKAFFADIRETGLVPDRGVRAWGAQLALPSPDEKRRLDELTRAAEDARCLLEAQGRTFAASQPAWEQQILRSYEAGRLTWKLQQPLSATATGGAVLTTYKDEPVDSTFEIRGSLVSERQPGNGIVIASGPNPDNTTYTITFQPGAGIWTALGLEVVQDENLPGVRVARGADRFVLSEVELEKNRAAVPIELATSSIALPVPNLPAMAAIDGDPKSGWGMSMHEGQNPFLALRLAAKLATDADSVITVRLRFDSEFRRAVIGRFRIALSDAEYSWPGRGSSGIRESPTKENGLPLQVLRALRTAEAERTPEQAKALREHFLWSSPDTRAALVRAERLEAQMNLFDTAIPRVVVTQSVAPTVTRVLPRANWMDESGEIVEPAVPGFLGKLATDRRATRLDLANWLVSSGNPLTARVYVNRLWRQFFGTGLSKTLDDLGSQGEWVRHAELIDWLAAEFMHPEWNPAGAHDWDVRHIIRTIVTSHAYRQSSLSNATLDAKDPDNRLLARQSRFRVDAELVRDIALEAAGLLVEKFGGPSVQPYQPDGYLAALNFPKREQSASRGGDLYRRGIYTRWQRTFVHPSLLTFDAPTREECTVNRSSSNTPLQALVLLNDPIFVEAARGLAQRMLTEGGRTLDARLDWAFLRAMGRPAVPKERRILADLYRSSRKTFGASRSDAAQLIRIGESPAPSSMQPAELAAMTVVARAILNLHETITRN